MSADCLRVPTLDRPGQRHLGSHLERILRARQAQRPQGLKRGAALDTRRRKQIHGGIDGCDNRIAGHHGTCVVGRKSFLADPEWRSAGGGHQLSRPFDGRRVAADSEAGAAQRRDSTVRIGNRLERMNDTARDTLRGESAQRLRAVGPGGVECNATAHPASRQLLRHRRDGVVGDSDENAVCKRRNVADERRLYAGRDERRGAVRMAGCSTGNRNGRDTGISQKPAKGLRDPAGSNDRRARRGHLIAANVRVSQPVIPDTTSALTLRSVSAPYSFTSPVTAGTIRWFTPLTIRSSTDGESLSFWAIWASRSASAGSTS